MSKLISRRIGKYLFGGSPLKPFNGLFQKITDVFVNNPILSFGLYDPEDHRINDTTILVSGLDENGYPTIGTTLKYALNETQPPLLGEPANAAKLISMAKNIRRFNTFKPARFLWDVPETATDAAAIMGHGEGYFLNGNNSYILSRSPQSGEPFLARIPKKEFELYKPAMDERGFLNLNELENASVQGLDEALLSRFPTTIAGRSRTKQLELSSKISTALVGKNKDMSTMLSNAKFIYKDGDNYFVSLIDSNGRYQLAKINENMLDALQRSGAKIPVIDPLYSETISRGRIPYTPDRDRMYDSRIIVNNPYDVDELPVYLQPSVYHPATYKSDAAFEFDVLNLNGPVMKVPKTPKVVEQPKQKLVKRPTQRKSVKPELPKVFFSTDGKAYRMNEDGTVLRIYSTTSTSRPQDTRGWADTGTKQTRKSNTQTKHDFDNDKYYNTRAGSSTAGRLREEERPLAIFYELRSRFPNNPALQKLETKVKGFAKSGKSNEEINKILEKDYGISWRIGNIPNEELNKLFEQILRNLGN